MANPDVCIDCETPRARNARSSTVLAQRDDAGNAITDTLSTTTGQSTLMLGSANNAKL